MMELITAALLAFVSLHGIHVTIGLGAPKPMFARLTVYHCQPAMVKALALPAKYRTHLDPALFCKRQ